MADSFNVPKYKNGALYRTLVEHSTDGNPPKSKPSNAVLRTAGWPDVAFESKPDVDKDEQLVKKEYLTRHIEVNGERKYLPTLFSDTNLDKGGRGNFLDAFDSDETDYDLVDVAFALEHGVPKPGNKFGGMM